MLGPGVNLQRVPWGGRTFEYVGGEVSRGRHHGGSCACPRSGWVPYGRI